MLLSTRRALAEAIGTGGLVATVVGSGIMATRLTQDVALQLLINALATVAVLAVLIWAVGPISGAHFNPVVTLVAVVRREIAGGEAVRYVIAQIVGGLAGTAVGNLMFDLPAWQASTKVRSSASLWLGEIVATAGLLALIGGLTRTGQGRLGPALVPAWIGAAYFFTSSTSFANPAVTIARSATDTFSGIAPPSVPGFVLAQLVGAAIGAGLTEFFYPRAGVPEPLDLPVAVHPAPGDAVTHGG
ncbi:MAG TPA: MIP/aquaporin family protein [Dermatophilaceae bacterium]|nr:MIP/aquaporin family protein [Dermatophilaceae bacterium]HOR17216.1 MIP/aquaporin family protein [Dermatophilaceae bacterium]HOV02611.1 MIP/aquaporin family protein [Dermatophilaceae bacterium]HPK90555.1 MIP/aquaporin family protein [Dermatophilaceae bacterium]HQG12256.1 MIP/aquaporin family protein [Dermatophilaceae bacterium]